MEGLESFFTAYQQLYLFFLSCALGVPMGIFYDLFRGIRIAFPHGKIAVMIEDLIFFLFYGVFLMCFTVTAAKSEFRFYYPMGNALGFVLYLVTVGRLTVKLMSRVAALVKSVGAVIMKKIALICGKIMEKFVGSLQIVAFRKKNPPTLLIDDDDLLYNRNKDIKKDNRTKEIL